MFRTLVAFCLGTSMALVPVAAQAADPEYSVTVNAPALKLGQAGALEVAFVPQGAWHWNTEYPARLTLTPPAGIVVTKATLMQKDNDFAAKNGRPVGSFEVKATSAVKAEGRIVGKVGFCDDKVCVTKKIDLPVQLVAR